MLEDLRIKPIDNPDFNPLAFEAPYVPPIYETKIGVEKKITSKQYEWIVCRDNGLCSFPIVNRDGTFADIYTNQIQDLGI